MGLLKEQEGLCRQIGDLHGLETTLGNQAVILRMRGQLDDALTLHREKERICRDLGDIDGVAMSLGNQALVLSDAGRPREARKLAEEAIGLARKHKLTRRAAQLQPILDDLPTP